MNVFIAEEKDNSTHVRELYNVHPNSSLHCNYIGEWSAELGWYMTSSFIWKRRSDLKEITFQTSVREVSNKYY